MVWPTHVNIHPSIQDLYLSIKTSIGLRPDWGLVRLRQGGVGLTLSGAKCNYYFFFFFFFKTATAAKVGYHHYTVL